MKTATAARALDYLRREAVLVVASAARIFAVALRMESIRRRRVVIPTHRRLIRPTRPGAIGWLVHQSRGASNTPQPKNLDCWRGVRQLEEPVHGNRCHYEKELLSLAS